MASKSNLNIVIDNGSGTTLSIQDDATGYFVLTMTDSKDSKAMKLGAADSHILRQALVFSDALRIAIPTS